MLILLSCVLDTLRSPVLEILPIENQQHDIQGKESPELQDGVDVSEDSDVEDLDNPSHHFFRPMKYVPTREMALAIQSA